MKTIRLLAVGAGVGLLLLSCYMMPKGSTGNIAFSTAGSRSITAGSDVVRVSLFSVRTVDGNLVGQTLFAFSGGRTYAEGSVGGTIRLTDIPAGTWAVLVAAGTKDTNGNFVVTDYSWPYAVLTVAPGVDNPVTVTLQKSPVAATGLFGTDVMGVTQAGTVYAVTPTKLYNVPGITSAGTLPGGVTANGLDAGYAGASPAPAPFIDTNAGVYYYSSGIQSDLAASNPISVLQSTAFTYSGSKIAVFYQNEGGFGGVSINSGTIGSWTNMDSSKTIPGKPVYDFTVTNASASPYAYIASKVGAFQANQTVVETQGAADNLLTNVTFFKAPDGSTILSLSAMGDNTPFYIGTSAGAWSATLHETPSFSITGATKIAETSGDSIIKIAAASGYVAFLSQYNLYILNTGSKNVKTYPFYSGLPGQLTGMAWDGSGTTLYVSGKADASMGNLGGLVAISGAGLP